MSDSVTKQVTNHITNHVNDMYKTLKAEEKRSWSNTQSLSHSFTKQSVCIITIYKCKEMYNSQSLINQNIYKLHANQILSSRMMSRTLRWSYFMERMGRWEASREQVKCQVLGIDHVVVVHIIVFVSKNSHPFHKQIQLKPRAKTAIN